MTALSVSGPDDWAALCSRTFVPLRVRTADPAFRAGLDHVALTDSAGITTVRSTASEVFRSARQIRSDPRDGFLLAVHGHGSGSVEQNGRLVTMTQGHAAIYDTETPYTLKFPTPTWPTPRSHPTRSPRDITCRCATCKPFSPRPARPRRR